MKLKYFTDINDDAICLVRVDSLDNDCERFFLINKDSFYSIKHTDDTIEIDDFGLALFNVTACPTRLLLPVKTFDDGRVYLRDWTTIDKLIATWHVSAPHVDIKLVERNCANIGVILPNEPELMLYPACNDLVIMDLSRRCVAESIDNAANEEGPNEDVTVSDNLCLISTSDKTRFLQELSSRQKSGYEFCSMTTSCVQVDGKLQVVFSSLLKAKEDTKK